MDLDLPVGHTKECFLIHKSHMLPNLFPITQDSPHPSLPWSLSLTLTHIYRAGRVDIGLLTNSDHRYTPVRPLFWKDHMAKPRVTCMNTVTIPGSQQASTLSALPLHLCSCRSSQGSVNLDNSLSNGPGFELRTN